MPKPTFKVQRESPRGMATERQIKYLEILLNDCGYSRDQRNGFLSIRFGREIRYLDELTLGEAGSAINELVNRRDCSYYAGDEDDDL